MRMERDFKVIEENMERNMDAIVEVRSRKEVEGNVCSISIVYWDNKLGNLELN